jgi:putative CRISPR-associated protein (TIGR02619 family)
MLNINYIITCGTSQLDPKKYTDFPGHPFAVQETRDSYINWHNPNLRAFVPDGWDDQKIEDWKLKTIKRLVEDFKQPGLSNVLGAELSTIKLRKEKHPSDMEYFHIIASETTDGKLAAEILCRTLLNLGMCGKKTIKPVKYLRDKLEDPGMASTGLNNLITHLFDALRTDAQNVFVISGGFKSVIPCITLLATMFGLEMIYLFEDSNLLQTYPATEYLHDLTNRRNWITDWDTKIYGKNIELAPWMRKLFDDGVQNDQMYT